MANPAGAKSRNVRAVVTAASSAPERAGHGLRGLALTIGVARGAGSLPAGMLHGIGAESPKLASWRVWLRVECWCSPAQDRQRLTSPDDHEQRGEDGECRCGRGWNYLHVGRPVEPLPVDVLNPVRDGRLDHGPLLGRESPGLEPHREVRQDALGDVLAVGIVAGVGRDELAARRAPPRGTAPLRGKPWRCPPRPGTAIASGGGRRGTSRSAPGSGHPVRLPFTSRRVRRW